MVSWSDDADGNIDDSGGGGGGGGGCGGGNDENHDNECKPCMKFRKICTD